MQTFLNTNGVALLEQASGLGGYLVSFYQQLAGAQAEADLLRAMKLDQSLLLEQGRPEVMPGNPMLGEQPSGQRRTRRTIRPVCADGRRHRRDAHNHQRAGTR